MQARCHVSSIKLMQTMCLYVYDGVETSTVERHLNDNVATPGCKRKIHVIDETAKEIIKFCG